MNGIVHCQHINKTYKKSASFGIKEIILRRHSGLNRLSRVFTLQDITFDVMRGQAFGVVGHNGAGKSTLLSLLLGVIEPDSGTIDIKGRIASLLELGAGFHPELTGRENIYLYGAILGMTRREIAAKIERIIEFSELEDVINYPIRTYSAGMQARLGFSTIINTNSDLILIDEVLAVGDNKFQEKCTDFLINYKNKNGTLIIVSHDMNAISSLCDEVMCLNMGKVEEIGKPDIVIDHYQHILKQNNHL